MAPLPRTKDVGKVMRFLKREKPGMPRKQKIAIALRQTGKSKFDRVKRGNPHPCPRKRMVRKKSLKQMLTEK